MTKIKKNKLCNPLWQLWKESTFIKKEISVQKAKCLRTMTWVWIMAANCFRDKSNDLRVQNFIENCKSLNRNKLQRMYHGDNALICPMMKNIRDQLVIR